MNDAPAIRLGEQVRTRRIELGIRQQDLEGVSTSTLTKIERGDTDASYRPATIRALEVGLRWGPGSVQAILAGGEPVELAEAETDPTLAALDRLARVVQELTEEVRARLPNGQ